MRAVWVRFSFSSSVFQLTLLDIYRPLPVWSASPTGILICCTVPSEAVPFVYLASLCRSLPCLISTLTQAGGGGLLFRFASSVLLRGGRGAAERYRCVWGALTVFRPHWVCPAQGCVCYPPLRCSGSRLLYMERALRCARFQPSGVPQKRGVGCASLLCLPRPEQLRQPGA